MRMSSGYTAPQGPFGPGPKCEECELPSNVPVCARCQSLLRPCTGCGGRVAGQVKQAWKTLCGTCFRAIRHPQLKRPHEMSSKSKPEDKRAAKKPKVAPRPGPAIPAATAKPPMATSGCATWHTFVKGFDVGMEEMPDDDALEMLHMLLEDNFRFDMYGMWVTDPEFGPRLGMTPLMRLRRIGRYPQVREHYEKVYCSK